MERLIRLLDDLDDLVLRLTWQWSAAARRRQIPRERRKAPANYAAQRAERVPAA